MLDWPVEGIFVGFSSSASCADASLKLVSLLSSAIEALTTPNATVTDAARFQKPIFWLVRQAKHWGRESLS